MNSRTFSPNHTSNEPPKVIKQDYSLEDYMTHFQDYHSDMGDEDRESESESEEEESPEEEEEESDDERNEEEILNELQRIKQNKDKQPVVIKKRSSTPPLIPTYLTSSLKNSLSSSSSNTTDYMNKMTLDLMMNPHYLSKANPEAFQRKIEQAQRILKHRREIYKTMDDCFTDMEKLASGKGQETVDLDIQTGFLHFAKTVLLNIQQQHAGKSGKEPIFSVCNDIYSSFYPDEEER